MPDPVDAKLDALIARHGTGTGAVLMFLFSIVVLAATGITALVLG
jgi:hypothetical protein